MGPDAHEVDRRVQRFGALVDVHTGAPETPEYCVKMAMGSEAAVKKVQIAFGHPYQTPRGGVLHRGVFIPVKFFPQYARFRSVYLTRTLIKPGPCIFTAPPPDGILGYARADEIACKEPDGRECWVGEVVIFEPDELHPIEELMV